MKNKIPNSKKDFRKFMHGDKKKILFIFILVMSLLALAGCSPMLRYKVLSVFFDGVPDPSIVVVDSLPKTDISAAQVLASRKMEPEFFSHPPYSEKKCIKCHNIGGGNQTFKPLPELCYGCHDDWSNKYKTLHGPVASGYCLKCHNQHLAKLPKLLLRPGQDLCLYCHNRKQVFQNKIHEHVGEKNCTDCHSPHGGDNRGMLRPGSCYNCHEKFAGKFKTLHGPVASGYCTACHASHETKVTKLLLRENQQICLYCHNQKQVLKNAAHKNIKKSKCTECHNPHGGEDRFILIQAALSSDRHTSGKEKNKGESDTLIISAPAITWEETNSYIVLGSFNNRENAQQFLDNLSPGDNALIITTSKGMYSVVYGYRSEKEAKDDLDKRKTIFPSAWISKKK